MKIDEGCINHNAVRLIEEYVGEWIWDTDIESEAKQPNALLTLAVIKGICDMADTMKQVLKE